MLWRLSCISCVFLVAVGVSTSQEPSTRFDPKPWLEDLEQAKVALVSRYANLDWAVHEHEIDLASLFRETAAKVALARTE